MTTMTVYEGTEALYGALSFPITEEGVETTLKTAGRVFGTDLVGVWEYESCWGLAGFLAIRIASPAGWRQVHPALMDHLRGIRPLQPGQSITGPTCDTYSPDTLTGVDGTNWVIHSEVYAAA